MCTLCEDYVIKLCSLFEEQFKNAPTMKENK